MKLEDVQGDGEANGICQTLELLDLHYEQFAAISDVAIKLGHPTPSDTRGWSQVLVSALTGIRGADRKKGPDLTDGSDVKAALVWDAVDKPRFNGVLKAGTKSKTAGKIESLNAVPHLFLVLWDYMHGAHHIPRCRIWCIRPQVDPLFRAMALTWFEIESTATQRNFQLHPPRDATRETNIIRNDLGSFEYPLYFCAVRNLQQDASYKVMHYDPAVLDSGLCQEPTQQEQLLIKEDSLADVISEDVPAIASPEGTPERDVDDHEDGG